MILGESERRLIFDTVDALFYHLNLIEHWIVTGLVRETDVLVPLSFYVDTMAEDFVAFECYAKWIGPMQEHFAARYPKSPQDSDAVHRSAIRAKALDTLRGLLPAATQSNLGIYGTGQAFEALLLRLRASPFTGERPLTHPNRFEDTTHVAEQQGCHRHRR